MGNYVCKSVITTSDGGILLVGSSSSGIIQAIEKLAEKYRFLAVKNYRDRKSFVFGLKNHIRELYEIIDDKLFLFSSQFPSKRYLL